MRIMRTSFYVLHLWLLYSKVSDTRLLPIGVQRALKNWTSFMSKKVWLKMNARAIWGSKVRSTRLELLSIFVSISMFFLWRCILRGQVNERSVFRRPHLEFQNAIRNFRIRYTETTAVSSQSSANSTKMGPEMLISVRWGYSKSSAAVYSIK